MGLCKQVLKQGSSGGRGDGAHYLLHSLSVLGPRLGTHVLGDESGMAPLLWELQHQWSGEDKKVKNYILGSVGTMEPGTTPVLFQSQTRAAPGEYMKDNVVKTRRQGKGYPKYKPWMIGSVKGMCDEYIEQRNK